jgi:hypothetical protein
MKISKPALFLFCGYNNFYTCPACRKDKVMVGDMNHPAWIRFGCFHCGFRVDMDHGYNPERFHRCVASTGRGL